MRIDRREARSPGNHETEAVVFVPCTYGGTLQRMIQEGEDKFIAGTNKKRIRVVERGGTKLQDLFNYDPGKKSRCEREGCLPCRSK